MTDPELTADDDAALPDQGGALRVPRSRGAVSGVLLMLAGIWGAFVPFVGPVFDFAYTPKPNESWHWTAARGWYEVLPGGIAFLGGLLLLLSANRIVAGLGAWIAVLAGGWFVVGQQVSFLLTLGSPGAPAAAGDRRYVAEYLTFFTGLGAAIILFGALAAGRLSVRSVRDARAAARRAREAALAEQEAADRDAAEREDYERATADRSVTDRNAETWSASERDGGYGTPGTGVGGSSHADSAVTTELPVAGAGAGAGVAGAAAHHDTDDESGRRDSRDRVEPEGADDHAAFRRATEAQERESADTQAFETLAFETRPSETRPSETRPSETRPSETRAFETQQAVAEPASAPEPQSAPVPAPAVAQPEPSETAEPPLRLEPPEGHPDAQRFRAAAQRPAHTPAVQQPAAQQPAVQQPEPQAPAADAPEPEVEPAGGPSTPQEVWNPAAQSPTTTGEIPVVGPPAPPAAAAEPRRGVHAPRRYFGAGNPAPDEPDAPAEQQPAGAVPAEQQPAGAVPAAPDRDAVRTDEGLGADDLDADDLDREERPPR